MSKRTIAVSKVVAPFHKSTANLTGCSIPLQGEKPVLLADVLAMAKELKRRGASEVVMNNYGFGVKLGNVGLHAIGSSRGPRLFGRYWRGIATWPKKLVQFLESAHIPYFTKKSASDEETLRELRI